MQLLGFGGNKYDSYLNIIIKSVVTDLNQFHKTRKDNVESVFDFEILNNKQLHHTNKYMPAA